jgi:beta-lactamase class A
MLRRNLFWTVGSAFSTLPLAAATKLSTAADKIIKRAPGKVWAMAKNLDSGAVFEHLADEPVRTASTIKLPIMVEAFAQVSEGKAKFEELIEISAEDKVSGSGVLTELSNGVRLPIRDLIHLMIVVSDNTATNLLIDRFSADAVNARMSSLGLRETFSMRKIMGDGKKLKLNPGGHSAAGRLESNKRFGIGRSSCRDMVRLLELLDQGKVISPAASSQMLEILKRQQYREGIARRRPDATMANKTGSLDALRSDVAIVYGKRAKLAMAITVDGIPGPNYSVDNPGLLTISQLSELFLDQL